MQTTGTLDARIVLVTGANGGLGEEFVRQCLERGASRVYAAARRPRSRDDDRIVPLSLDITDPASVLAAAAQAADVDLLINNAGISLADDRSLLADPEDILRATMETNFFGTLRLSRAFAPVLGANGGGAIVNVLSAASWFSVPTAYAASKAAMWSASNSMRVELKAQGTAVVGVHVGMVDTPMSAAYDVPKVSAASVVEQTLDGLAAGVMEVLADDVTRQLKLKLGGPAEAIYSRPTFLPPRTLG